MINFDKQDTPLESYLDKLTSEDSARVMRGSLDAIAKHLTDGAQDATTFEWHRLRYNHIVKIRTWVAKHYKVSTANRALSALRGVLKAAWRAGMMTNDDYFAATDFLKIRGRAEPPGRMLADDEVAALLRVCREENTLIGWRDYAMIITLYATGARRDEFINILVSDYRPDESYIMIRKGKGRKERRVYLSPAVVDAINTWLAVYDGTGDAALFCQVWKGGRIGAGIVGQTVHDILTRRAEQAGIEKVAPHDMRRTFISSLIDKGVDLSTVARLAGHEDVRETASYDRRKNEPSQRAAMLMTVPV